MSIFFFSVLAAFAWVVKDCIQAKSITPIVTNWEKYAGCLVCALLYGYLSSLTFFRYISILGVVALAGNSFSTIKTFVLWVYSKIHPKK